jgi:voltage-gated potassium channel
VSAQRLTELDKPTRRRAVLRTTVSIVLTWFVTFSIYFVLPLEREIQGIVVQLVLGVLAFVGIAAWQTVRIVRSKVPALQAIEALGVLGAFFIVLFATTYLAIGTARPESFTQGLDHMASLYFTITVLATVGFGDISAVTPVARAIVSTQMILDLVLLAGVARVVVSAAQRSLAGDPPPDA